MAGKCILWESKVGEESRELASLGRVLATLRLFWAFSPSRIKWLSLRGARGGALVLPRTWGSMRVLRFTFTSGVGGWGRSYKSTGPDLNFFLMEKWEIWQHGSCISSW